MKHFCKRTLCLLLTLAMLLSVTGPAFAARGEADAKPVVSWELVSTGRATPTDSGLPQTSVPAQDPAALVRVSIVLAQDGTLARGWSTKGVADNPAAMNYRAALKAAQNALADKISREILEGEPLEVVWNITLAANIISAYVPYGKLAAIEALDEVKSVVLEAQYEPDNTLEEGDDPNMYRSPLQTGTDVVWAQGITGAGSRVAVIDTGIETDHRSFSGPALEYSLQQNAAALEMDYAEYAASLHLLTAEEVQSHLEELNVQIDPNTTYVSAKIPYAYNYVDSDYDVTHRNDAEGNHGSHVEGIAAANKYAPEGDGFVEAANGSNKVKGQAYDAQILTMKVFGKGGGAFDSDYMVAIEDAIILGADSVNLSLGSASPGMCTSQEYQSILNSLTQSDTLVCISMGNAYHWSYAAGGPSRNLYYDDANYYTGGSPGSFSNAFTVASVGSGSVNANGRYTMSSFSSWGVPSSLELKPEITAPGGNILSVNGSNTTGYTNMSGTSMAAPQISGIAALVAQYIRENGLTREDLSVRQLAQSLIMSTAVPIRMTNNNYIYYPVIQQGAGLARTDKALSAKTYVLIDPNSLPARAPLAARASVADGKVKVELGDDPDFNGVYSFAYSLNNLTDEPVIYELDADFFTQNITGSGNNQARAQTIVMLNAGLSWTVNGQPIDQIPPEGLADLSGDGLITRQDAQVILDLCAGLIEALPANGDKADLDGDGDVDTYDAYLLLKALADAEATNANYVTVPAGGSVSIGLTFDLKDSIDAYSYNGNYVEGYVYAREVSASGSEGADHSIPVMGYYGSWTDFSMFNKGSYLEYTYGGETRNPYLNSVLGSDVARALQTFQIRYAGQEFGNPIGGNPVVAESYYDPDRNAIAPAYGDEIFTVRYSAIRNAAASRFRVMQEGVAEPIAEILGGASFGAYYNSNDGSWYNTNAMPDINCFLPESIPNNAKLTLSFELAPEYYVRSDGSVDWDALHSGAKLTLPITVDNEAPVIEDVSVSVSDITGARSLLVTARDNQYIAAFRLLKEDGTVVFSQGSDPSASANEAYTASCALTDDTAHYLVEVTDYALNVGTYRLNFNKDELTDPEITMTLDRTELEIIGKGSEKLTATLAPWGVADGVIWSTSDPAVATVNGRGVVTGVETGTAVITATSVAYPEISASATVTVRFIEKTLNGIVCDEHGAAYVIEFNMRDLPSYQTLHEEPLSAWVYETAIDRSGTVYVSTYDGSSQSPLYTINLETMELTLLGNGTSRTYYTDIEAAGETLYDRGILLGVYGTNLYTINKSNGSRASQISMRSYTGSGSLVGISFHKSEENVDYYFLLTQSGAVYEVGLNVSNNAVAVASAEQVLNFGYTADTNYWQDLYFDGESLFWSRIDLGISRVDLIMAENFEALGAESKIIRAGSFAVDVWPVGGLFELSKVPGYTPPDPEPEPAPGNGGLNAVLWAEPEDAFAGKTLQLVAEEPTTNGAFTITFPSTVSFVSAESDALKAVNAGDGQVILTFATAQPIAAGELIALLNFTNESAGAVSVTATERNGAHLEEEPVIVTLGGDAPPAPVYGVPTWSWAEDYSMANAVFTGSDGSVLTLAASISVNEGTPDCTNAAQTVYTASVTLQEQTYTDEKTVNLEALGHDYTAVVTPPTCTEGGYTTYTCTRCEDSYTGDETEALGHAYGDPTWSWNEDCTAATASFPCARCEDVQTVEAELAFVTVDPDCETPGQTTVTASVLFENVPYSDVQILSLEALGHDWDAGTQTAAPGCTNVGVIVYTCTRCEETRTEALAALGHDPQTVAALEPTCTTPGHTAGSVCARCDAVLEGMEELPALGHTIVVDEAVAPGCTTSGLTAGAHCSVCTTVLVAQQTISPLGHDAQPIAAIPATCTEPGATAGSLCARCGEILTAPQPVEPLGHDFGDWTQTVAPSCVVPGVESRGCSRCDAVETRSVNALGHSAELIPGTAPTCTEPGATIGIKCPICQTVLFAPQPLEPIGHAYGEPQWSWNEDLTAATATFICAHDAAHTVELPAQIQEELISEAAPHIAGERKYTASVTFNGTPYTDEKFVEIEALPCPCAQFVDIPAYGTPEHEAIDWAFTHQPYQVTAGVDDTHFAPDNIVNRAQAMVFLYAAFDKPAASGKLPFQDLKGFSWAKAAIQWAVANEITSGTDATHFSPAKTCSRAEIVMFLWKAAGAPEPTIENPYSDTKGKYYQTAATWAYEMGIETGTGTKFKPNTACTRASTVLYLYRFELSQPPVE